MWRYKVPLLAIDQWWNPDINWTCRTWWKRKKLGGGLIGISSGDAEEADDGRVLRRSRRLNTLLAVNTAVNSGTAVNLDISVAAGERSSLGLLQTMPLFQMSN